MNTQGKDGDITRYGVAARWADKVVHRGTVYMVEVPATSTADIGVQAAEVLTSIERQLAEVGSDKSRLLMVTIYLKDFADAPAFNEVWEAWLPPGGAPARTTVEGRATSRQHAVKIAVTAAIS